MADQKVVKKTEKPKIDIKKTGKDIMAEQKPPTPEQQQSDMMSYLNNLR